MNAEYYIRQLKLYDILGYTKDPKVELLVKHINKNFLNLTIKEDYWYNEKGEKLINQDLKYNIYYLDYNIVWKFFRNDLFLEYLDTRILTKYILETHYKLKGITTWAQKQHLWLN